MFWSLCSHIAWWLVTTFVCPVASAATSAESPHSETTPVANKWFVSPIGDDRWSGTLPKPNAAKTDGPVVTIGRAAELVRSRGSASRKVPISVTIAPGRYEQTTSLVLGAHDGGDSEAGRVTWRGPATDWDGAGEGAVLSFPLE